MSLNYINCRTAGRIFLFFSAFFLCTALYSQNIYTVAGTGTMGYNGDGIPATTAELYDPVSLGTDGAGNIYVADFDNVRIRKIDISGIITTVTGIGIYPGGYSGDGGPATAAQIAFPWGVTADYAGNVYIADCGNNCIRKVNTSGIITTIIGYGHFPGGYGGDGGPATAADFNASVGVAIDLTGNIYIADEGNNRIRKVNTSGIITTIAGNGTGGYSGDGGMATAAEIYTPWAVTTDVAGNVYIADEGNHTIRKVNTNGIISTIAGDGKLGYSGDGGLATAAEIGDPKGITVDAGGNIFIADWYMNVIREVNTSGIITTVAGNGGWSYSGDGGPATAATLENPSGVGTDCAGNLYIADNSNQRIRMVANGATANLPSATLHSSKDTLCMGDSAILTAGGGTAYLWKPGFQTTSTLTVKPAITSTYTVVVTNGVCADSATMTIVTHCPVAVTEPCGTVFVPDAFSPNNDGQNDMLYVHFNSTCVRDMDFVIMDRWGNKVFESQNINEGWDGRYHEQPMNAGTYVYYLHLTDNNDKDYSIKGNIALVR